MPVIYIYAINTTAGRDNKLYESPIYRWSIFADGLQQADVLIKFSWPPSEVRFVHAVTAGGSVKFLTAV